MQRADIFAAGAGIVDLGGAGTGALEIAHDDRIQNFIVAFDAVEIELKQFEGADAAGFQRCDKFCGGLKDDVGH